MRTKHMVIISGASNVELARRIGIILEVPVIVPTYKKWGDGSLDITVKETLLGKDMLLIQSTSYPADQHLVELLWLVDLAKRAGSKHITLIAPYFGYSRQDKIEEGKPLPIALVARLIQAAGVDKLITIDAHSDLLAGFLDIELVNLLPWQYFTSLFTNIKDAVVISPDRGGAKRASALAAQLGVAYVILTKTRDKMGYPVIESVSGAVRDKNCIIIDDIIDSGRTLYEAATFLKRAGALSVHCCVTHSIFSAGSIAQIANIKFSSFYTTDTLSHTTLPSYVKVLSIARLIAEAVA